MSWRLRNLIRSSLGDLYVLIRTRDRPAQEQLAGVLTKRLSQFSRDAGRERSLEVSCRGTWYPSLTACFFTRAAVWHLGGCAFEVWGVEVQCAAGGFHEGSASAGSKPFHTTQARKSTCRRACIAGAKSSSPCCRSTGSGAMALGYHSCQVYRGRASPSRRRMIFSSDLRAALKRWLLFQR